jgi:hypothetical protein
MNFTAVNDRSTHEFNKGRIYCTYSMHLIVFALLFKVLEFWATIFEASNDDHVSRNTYWVNGVKTNLKIKKHVY